MNQVRDQILKSIVNSGSSCVSPEYICNTIECPANVVEECLFDLETNGLVINWESEEGLVVTLTPISAQMLNVHLVEHNQQSFWTDVDTPTKFMPQNRLRNHSFVKQMGVSYVAVDEMPEPDVQAMIAEEIGAVSIVADSMRKSLPKRDWRGDARFDQFSLPYPTTLLGGGIALWDNMKYDVCPGCKGKELEPHEYCLRCDNWGMDRYLEKSAERLKIRAYAQRKATMVNMGKRVDNGKQHRKNKRKHKIR